MVGEHNVDINTVKPQTESAYAGNWFNSTHSHSNLLESVGSFFYSAGSFKHITVRESSVFRVILFSADPDTK